MFYPAHEYTITNLRFGLSIEPDNAAMRQTLGTVEQMVAKGIASLPVTLAHEKKVNVFMRSDVPETVEGVKNIVDLDDSKPLTIFAALRELKNNF